MWICFATKNLHRANVTYSNAGAEAIEQAIKNSGEKIDITSSEAEAAAMKRSIEKSGDKIDMTCPSFKKKNKARVHLNLPKRPGEEVHHTREVRENNRIGDNDKAGGKNQAGVKKQQKAKSGKDKSSKDDDAEESNEESDQRTPRKKVKHSKLQDYDSPTKGNRRILWGGSGHSSR